MSDFGVCDPGTLLPPRPGLPLPRCTEAARVTHNFHHTNFPKKHITQRTSRMTNYVRFCLTRSQLFSLNCVGSVYHGVNYSALNYPRKNSVEWDLHRSGMEGQPQQVTAVTGGPPARCVTYTSMSAGNERMTE